jgi:nucleoside-diphosphate-sugar epimerase
MLGAVIAVTGAGGFLGRHLVAELRRQRRTVIPIYHGDKALFDGKECFADLTRPESAQLLLRQGFNADIILHLAGAIDIAFKPDPANPTGMCLPGREDIGRLYRVNVIATATVAELALLTSAKRMIFASSQTVYGFGEGGMAHEQTALCPLEHYACSKACAERLLEMTTRQGLTVTVLRFAGIFSTDRKNGAVYGMCRSAITDNLIVVRSEVAIPFAVIAMSDVVAGILKAIDFEGRALEIFNLADPDPCSLEILAERIAALVSNCRVEKNCVPQPPFRMRADRAASLLGWCTASLELRLNQILSSIRDDLRTD